MVQDAFTAARVPDRWTPPRPTPFESLVGAGATAGGALAGPVLRRLVRGGLDDVFRDGEPPPAAASPGEPVAGAGDPGWFGPGSVSWYVHADTAMFVGGIAALAYQALHPLAMAGVMEHSDFDVDPLGRLQRTADFVGTTAYGTTAEAEQACRVVRSIHDRVVGTAPDGRPYAANDPDLLDWVHVSEFAAFAAANRRYAAEPMTDADLDRYVAEVGVIATELGNPDPPSDWASVEEHLDHHRRVAVVGRQARDAWAFLRDPPLPGPARAVYPVLFRGALACLPPWATDLWGVERPSAAERAACRALVRGLGGVIGRSPGLDAALARVSTPPVLAGRAEQ